MNKIIEYSAVCESGDYKKLNQAVNRLLKQGFEPFGDVSTCVDSDTVYFTQAMVKYDKKTRKVGVF